MAFFVFNRPETTKRVWAAIRQAAPEKLLIVADGPRHNEEKAKCLATRAITEEINWPCEVTRNYAEKNLGCRQRVSSGLDWVFQNAERAIILEDDCLPSESFFYFCEELLEKYRTNEKIKQVAGLNTQAGNKKFHCKDSYYFSQIPQIWGWASWRRAWRNYDVDMNDWPEFKNSEEFKKILPNFSVRQYWQHLWDHIYQDKNPATSTWDAQWFYAVVKNQGLSIVPQKNLITNIGFSVEATHAKGSQDEKNNLSRTELTKPFRHPSTMAINKQADDYTWKFVFRINNSWGKKIRNWLKQMCPNGYYRLRSWFKAE